MRITHELNEKEIQRILEKHFQGGGLKNLESQIYESNGEIIADVRGVSSYIENGKDDAK